jgi:phosphoribosyl-AMP cyclohydrolase
MVLPLLPIVCVDDAFESETMSAAAFKAIGQVYVRATTENLDKTTEFIEKIPLDVIVDTSGLSVDQQIKLLDSGAIKIVVTKAQVINDVPAERLLVKLSEDELATPAGIEDIANAVSGIILDSSYTISVDPESLKSIVHSLQKSLLPTGGQRKVYLEYSGTTSPPTIAELKSLALLSIDPILPATYLTNSPKEHKSLLSVAQIALLGARTDRADGLYTTIVVDERGVALGLVYSSTESIVESIRTGTGVYQSRERGLWYKGATSGATQELLGMAWDCDADCLLFTVKQAGKGSLTSN